MMKTRLRNSIIYLTFEPSNSIYLTFREFFFAFTQTKKCFYQGRKNSRKLSPQNFHGAGVRTTQIYALFEGTETGKLLGILSGGETHFFILFECSATSEVILL